jgi:hypothetical protein
VIFVFVCALWCQVYSVLCLLMEFGQPLVAAGVLLVEFRRPLGTAVVLLVEFEQPLVAAIMLLVEFVHTTSSSRRVTG